MSTARENVKFRDSISEFNQIRTNGLSGNLLIEITGASSWMLCFSSGKLAGISGGIDAIERWQRNLALASLNMPVDRVVKSDDRQEAFLNANKLAQELAAKEVLFDIIQLSQNNGDCLSYRFIPIGDKTSNLQSNLPLLDIQPLLTSAIQSWQEWSKYGLGKYVPSWFPALKQPQRLKEFDNLQDLQSLIEAIDGAKSLRSLAIYHQKQLIYVGNSLLPLLESGIITISEIQCNTDSAIAADSPGATLRDRDSQIPASLITPTSNAIESEPKSFNKLTPLIACIDDSVSVYKNLEKIISQHGYQVYGIQDPLKIVTTLIRNKPDLIFLDLVMPVINGYEACEQIRKTPSLANVPIIILTGSDGLIDRVRTKFVGANGFLGKPIEAGAVIKMMDKYLDRVASPQANRQQSHKPSGGGAKSNGNAGNNGGKRILVVDDDRSIREVVSMCLSKLKGWDVITAASGRDGLNSIKNTQPDTIVLDVMMPEMDGLAFLRNLRANAQTRSIPVVLLTANRYLPDKELLDELGVFEVMSKPFMPIDLVRNIERALAAELCSIDR